MTHTIIWSDLAHSIEKRICYTILLLQRLLECDLKPLSPTEEQVDSMVTSHISYSEDYHHSKSAPQLPGFTLPGAVPEDTEMDEWENPQRFTEVSKHDTEVFTSEQTSTPLVSNAGRSLLMNGTHMYSHYV